MYVCRYEFTNDAILVLGVSILKLLHLYYCLFKPKQHNTTPQYLLYKSSTHVHFSFYVIRHRTILNHPFPLTYIIPNTHYLQPDTRKWLLLKEREKEKKYWKTREIERGQHDHLWRHSLLSRSLVYSLSLVMLYSGRLCGYRWCCKLGGGEGWVDVWMCMCVCMCGCVCVCMCGCDSYIFLTRRRGE